MILLGYAADDPELDPSLSVSAIASILRSPDAVYRLENPPTDQFFFIFFSGKNAVCIGYHPHSMERDSHTMGIPATFFYTLMSMRSTGDAPADPASPDQSPLAILACPSLAERQSKSFQRNAALSKLCPPGPDEPVDVGQNPSATKANTGTGGSPDPNSDKSQIGDNANTVDPGTGNSPVPAAETISARLDAGGARTAEVDLLLCAAEHERCTLTVSPATARLFLEIKTSQQAETRLHDILVA